MTSGQRWLVGIAVATIAIYYYHGTGKQPRYAWYTVHMELLVDGEPVTIEETIGCDRPFLLLTPMPRYQPTSTSVVKRLDSGAGILAKPIHYCEKAARGKNDIEYSDYPELYLIDDLDDPKVIERYRYTMLDFHKNSRVELTSIKIDSVGQSAIGNFGILSYYHNAEINRHLKWVIDKNIPLEKEWIGFQVKLIHSHEIDRVQELSKYLKKYESPTVLKWDEVLEQLGGDEKWYHNNILWLNKCSTKYIDKGNKCDYLKDVYGMIPLESTPGARYSDVDRNYGHTKYVNLPFIYNLSEGYTVEIGETRFSKKTSVSDPEILYDPATNTIYSIRSSHARLGSRRRKGK